MPRSRSESRGSSWESGPTRFPCSRCRFLPYKGKRFDHIDSRPSAAAKLAIATCPGSRRGQVCWQLVLLGRGGNQATTCPGQKDEGPNRDKPSLGKPDRCGSPTVCAPSGCRAPGRLRPASPSRGLLGMVNQQTTNMICDPITPRGHRNPTPRDDEVRLSRALRNPAESRFVDWP